MGLQPFLPVVRRESEDAFALQQADIPGGIVPDGVGRLDGPDALQVQPVPLDGVFPDFVIVVLDPEMAAFVEQGDAQFVFTVDAGSFQRLPGAGPDVLAEDAFVGNDQDLSASDGIKHIEGIRSEPFRPWNTVVVGVHVQVAEAVPVRAEPEIVLCRQDHAVLQAGQGFFRPLPGTVRQVQDSFVPDSGQERFSFPDQEKNVFSLRPGPDGAVDGKLPSVAAIPEQTVACIEINALVPVFKCAGDLPATDKELPYDPETFVEDGECIVAHVPDPDMAVPGNEERIVEQFAVEVDRLDAGSVLVRHVQALPGGEQEVPFIPTADLRDARGVDPEIRVHLSVADQADAGTGPDPEPSSGIRAKRTDEIVRKSAFLLVVDDICAAVVPVQPAGRPDPDISFTVFSQAAYIRIRQLVHAGWNRRLCRQVQQRGK